MSVGAFRESEIRILCTETHRVSRHCETQESGAEGQTENKRARRHRPQVNYKESGQRLTAETIAVKREIKAESEAEALKGLTPSSEPLRYGSSCGHRTDI